MLHHFLLILHLVAATIWVGGHVILCFRIFPQAWKSASPQRVTDFEERFELLGIPALLVLVVTGIWMAADFGISISHWFAFNSAVEKVVSVKLILLFATVLLAVHARIFLIPKLSVKNMGYLGLHILSVTLIGLAMLVLGSFVRYGGIG